MFGYFLDEGDLREHAQDAAATDCAFIGLASLATHGMETSCLLLVCPAQVFPNPGHSVTNLSYRNTFHNPSRLAVASKSIQTTQLGIWHSPHLHHNCRVCPWPVCLMVLSRDSL